MDGEQMAKVGHEAAKLMDDLAEDETVPENAVVELVGLAVTLRYPDDVDGTDYTATHTRVNSTDRLHQIALFVMASRVAEDSPDAAEEDE